MVQTNKIFFLSAVAVFIMYTALCFDPFESTFGIRLQCYKNEQPGCNRSLIEAYPKCSRSYTNLTVADTYIYLFTNNNTEDPEIVHKCPGTLPPYSKFNPKCHTEFIIPGFVSGVCNMAIFREVKNERLKSGCYNVFMIDYMWGNSFDLVETTKNLPIVACQITILIRHIKKAYGLTADDFTLTGHSFGAHVAGFVGKVEKIGQIIGLDPAGGPFRKDTPPDQRLDPSDAKCVQVWHCNTGDCLPEFFGLNLTLGTIDFWINGGSFQPSCRTQSSKAFMKGDFIYGLFTLFPPACFHFQCVQYYRASMNSKSCPFIGAQCTSYKAFQHKCCNNCGCRGEKCQVMGIHACSCLTDNKKNKSYYMNTALECPYCDNSGLKNTDRATCKAAGVYG